MNSIYRTMVISKEESLASIAEKCKLLESEERFKLRLPSKLNTGGALGIEVALIQLLGTWLRQPGYEKILHSYQNAGTDTFASLCSTMYGIACLCLVDEIWDEQGNKIPRSKALFHATKIIDGLRSRNYEDSFKDHYFGIPCVKKPGYDREFDMPVYNNGAIVSSDAFYALFRKVIKRNVKYSGRMSRLGTIVNLRDLSELIWEMFKNTHDHGRQDVHENDLSLNFRGFLVQQYDLTDRYLAYWLGATPSRAQLCLKENWNENSERLQVLDISVIDFGAGFIDLAKRKLDDCTDLSVLASCFSEGWSRLRNSNRGDGLTKVLSCIQKYEGWLRVRTGNVLLEKTFSPNSDFRICEDDLTVMDHSVAGASFHIALPLNIGLQTKASSQ